jgi:hypothetical protein
LVLAGSHKIWHERGAILYADPSWYFLTLDASHARLHLFSWWKILWKNKEVEWQVNGFQNKRKEEW